MEPGSSEPADPDTFRVVYDLFAMAGAMTTIGDQGATHLPTVLLRIDSFAEGRQLATIDEGSAPEDRFRFLMSADAARQLGQMLLETAEQAGPAGS